MNDTEIEVKHEGILEVPEGKNVDDLPISHFEKLANKKGLGKINKALNNLQVWNKKKNPKLARWADNMIDKLNKRFGKDESMKRHFVKEGFGIEDAPGLYQKVYKIVRDNHINASVIDSDDSDDNGFVEINIHGDWKHDHLRLKYLLEQAFGTVLWREKNHYPSDDDCYEAEYTVYLADPQPGTTNWTNENINLTRKRKLKEGTRGFISPNEAAEHYYEYGNYALWPDNIEDELRSKGYSEDFISEVFYIMNEMADDDATREEEYIDGDLEDVFDYAMGESVNRKKLSESLYSIMYDYDYDDGSEYGGVYTSRNNEEQFRGSWSDLQEYLKQIKEQGCYNIDVTEMDYNDYDDDDYEEDYEDDYEDDIPDYDEMEYSEEW